MNRWRRSEIHSIQRLCHALLTASIFETNRAASLSVKRFFFFFFNVRTVKHVPMLTVSSVLINPQRDRRMTGPSFYVALQLRFIVLLHCRWQAANLSSKKRRRTFATETAKLTPLAARRQKTVEARTLGFPAPVGWSCVTDELPLYM